MIVIDDSLNKPSLAMSQICLRSGRLLMQCPLSPKVTYPWDVRIPKGQQDKLEECDMAWSKPKAREVKCGMEINMYGPGEDERDAEREVI